MDKLTSIRIKRDDGTYSDKIFISALSENIIWDNSHTLVDVLGNIDIQTGTVQEQIDKLFQEKINYKQLVDYVHKKIGDDISTWLENNLHAIQGSVLIDGTLTQSQQAADAAATGNQLRTLDSQVQTLAGDMQSAKDQLKAVSFSLDNYVDDGYVENGVAYFVHNGEVLFEITGIGGGGGGGGSSVNNATITVTNNTGWLSTTISSGSTCPISLNWTSIEDNLPTGDGTLQISVNGAIKSTQGIQQGNVNIDLGNYVSAGSNIVKVKISDIYGNARTINFNITVIVLSVSSSFDTSIVYNGAISFPYTPVGAVEKTVYFILDGRQIGTQQTSVSGRQLTYIIPAQSHGNHTLRIYFEAEINGETVKSNQLYYDFISVVDGNHTVIIASPYNADTQPQYTSIIIPYTVYNPDSLTAEVEIYANNNLLSTQTVDRTQQSYTYRAEEAGSLKIELKSGNTTKTFNITITESDIDVAAETENLALYLSSNGRNNQQVADRETWEYKDIAVQFSNFNWSSDGWLPDKDGIPALKVTGDARVTIPYQPFANDFRTTGKTIEIEFATSNVLNYDAVILSCMSGGRGINITAQKATLVSQQSEISTQYKEDEHVRIAFVVQKRSQGRLLYIYINGIASGVVQYPVDDDFSQVAPVDITIGSNDCTIDIYNIRVYDNNLTRFQVVNNWIADTQNGGLMLDRYIRNNVFDAYGNIVISNLPNGLSYLIISCAELPQSKGDKKICSGSFVNPTSPARSFTFENCQIDVQGTSSQYYARKNYKMKFNGGFTMTSSGSNVSKYAMNADAIPVKTFCMKADYASSEGANNVELVRLYEQACPYKTPGQLENEKVRQGIDGFPILIFWNNTASGETTFIGKYNFNNDKSTEEVFGFKEDDESWETLNNASDRALYKSGDFSGDAWKTDFEARYPDLDPPYDDITQLAEFATWAASTDTTAATGNALDSSVTYNGVTYTHDTAEYRLAKFKAEAENYMEIDSALFYYLFTELFLMVDSRAKNAFPSFMGSEVNI